MNYIFFLLFAAITSCFGMDQSALSAPQTKPIPEIHPEIPTTQSILFYKFTLDDNQDRAASMDPVLKASFIPHFKKFLKNCIEKKNNIHQTNHHETEIIKAIYSARPLITMYGKTAKGHDLNINEQNTRYVMPRTNDNHSSISNYVKILDDNKGVQIRLQKREDWGCSKSIEKILSIANATSVALDSSDRYLVISAKHTNGSLIKVFNLEEDASLIKEQSFTEQVIAADFIASRSDLILVNTGEMAFLWDIEDNKVRAKLPFTKNFSGKHYLLPNSIITSHPDEDTRIASSIPVLSRAVKATDRKRNIRIPFDYVTKELGDWKFKQALFVAALMHTASPLITFSPEEMKRCNYSKTNIIDGLLASPTLTSFSAEVQKSYRNYLQAELAKTHETIK